MSSILSLLAVADREVVIAAAAASGVGPDRLLATVAALRASYPPDVVAGAVEQARLRERAVRRFGADAARMYFTAAGLEQATRPSVAAYRAGRYAAAGADRVLDLCCGIGSDAIGLARAGLAVTGVERDPETAAVAVANAAALGLTDRINVRTGDALEVPLAGWRAAFCDPARREGGRRIFDPADYSPPFSFLTDLARQVAMTGAKVAPGIAHGRLPAGAEAEWISDHGEVVEAAVWWGPLGSVMRRATLLPGPNSLPASGSGPPAVRPPGRYLYEPDGAVIRAHLVAEVCDLVDGWLLDRQIAYVASDLLAPTAFARCYEVTDVLPFSLKRLRAVLRARGVGVVTIKKRGSAVVPEQLRRDLRLSGPAETTVVLTRIGAAPTVLLCHPV